MKQNRKISFVQQYHFYKNKYGDELLVDVVELKDIKKYLKAYPVHSLWYYDITLIARGCGTFSIDEQTYNVAAGDLIFSSPGQIRSWDKENIEEGYALIFDKEFLETFFRDSGYIDRLNYFHPRRASSRMYLEKEIFELIVELILRIQREINTYVQKDEHILRAMLYQVLSLLNREYQVRVGTEFSPSALSIRDNHFKRFTELVEEYFGNIRLVSFYAEQLCLTPNYLNELVKEHTGGSAKQYIRKRGVTEGKRYLRYTELTIAEIAYRLNYESPSYFARTFKSVTGTTPQEYRKINREK